MGEELEIVIHGGGYVGLTGAVHMALAGVKVTIYDPDTRTVNSINSGTPRSNEYLGYIDTKVAELVKSGLLSATIDYDSVKSKSIHFIAVPTEKGDEPFMDIVIKTIERLCHAVPEYGTVIVESTLQPGTIDKCYIPRVRDKKVYLAVCPRLDWFADESKNVTNLPRIIGGYNKESTDRAADILSLICKNIEKTGYREAEFAKAGQNDLYYSMIERAHEMALLNQDKADMNEVMRLISLHWRIPEVYLGPGVSGRCIRMGADYIRRATGKYAPINEAALAMNERWKEVIATRLVRDLPVADEKSVIFIMGIAYRANFSDFGYSAGLGIAKNLKESCWNVYIHDPILSDETLNKTGVPTGTFCLNPDVILLATGHDQYKYLPEFSQGLLGAKLIVDACGLWEKYRQLFINNKIKYIRVGEENWVNK